jgi:hypothetical protein
MAQVLLILFIVMAIITVVGHGIWVFLAWLNRIVSGGVGERRLEHRRTDLSKDRCPYCEWPMAPGQLRCGRCGGLRAKAVNTELDDLAATQRQLMRLVEAGSLDIETYKRLENCLGARRVLVAEPRSSPVLEQKEPEKVAPPAAESPEPVAAAAEPVPHLVIEAQSEAPPPLVEEEILEVTPVLSSNEPEVEAVEPPLAPPQTPRRTVGQVLTAFMEERNILWGELVGGLLMVGCSIALVISLWKTLEEIPYFPFLIFAAITCAVFAGGLYTLHHWKLESTSRGLLVIASLLVPLNFLVMAGLLSARTVESEQLRLGFRVGVEGVVILAFALLLVRAGRVLVEADRWLLTLAVLGGSTSQLAVHWFVNDAGMALGSSLFLGFWPVVCQAGCAALIVGRLWHRSLAERQAYQLFAFLGLATFPAAIALGFLVSQSSGVGVALERLALPLAVLGIPLVAVGLLAHMQLGEENPEATESRRSLEVARTAGTAVALAGMVVMLAAVVLAWPQPVALLAVCTLNGIVLTVFAFACGLPALHVGAVTCLVVAFLTASHLVTGGLAISDEALSGQLITLAVSARSGVALVAVVLLLAVAAELLTRAGQRSHAVYYATASGAVALGSLTLVNLHGISTPALATLVTSFYGVASLVLNRRWRRLFVNYAGLALLAAATVWGLWWREQALTPVWNLTLALESLCLAAIIKGRPATRDLAAAVGILAVCLTTASVLSSDSLLHPAALVLLGGTAFLLTWAYGTPVLCWTGSALMLAALWDLLAANLGHPLVSHPLVIALLTHASLMLASSLLLRELIPARLYARPLLQSALTTSLFVVPLFFTEGWDQLGRLSGQIGWLAALWLAMAWRARSAVLFTAFQAATTATVLMALTAWFDVPLDRLASLGTSHNLRIYGIALAGLALMWVIMRLALRDNERAQHLLEPSWPAVDQVVLGVLVLGQYVLAWTELLPIVVYEVFPADRLVKLETLWGDENFNNLLASTQLGALALVLIPAIWDRRGRSALLGLVVLAATIPLLAAGPAAKELAASAVLRWSLVLCLLVCSAPFWLRHNLRAVPSDDGRALQGTSLLRGVLLALTVGPVLAVTLADAWVLLSGQTPRGSDAGSLGWTASLVLPLLLIVLGLVGHALRERSAGYAFAAGLLVDATVLVGYALHTILHHHAFGEANGARLVQWGSISAALWGIVWLASRRWVAAWREESDKPLARPLMAVQLARGELGNVALLFGALVLLVLLPTTTAWTAETGSLLGWLAFLLMVIAGLWRLWQQNAYPHPYMMPGFLGLAVMALFACSVAGQSAVWGYRVLMLGWAACTPVLVLAGWWKEQQGEDPEASTPTALRTFLLQVLFKGLSPEAVAYWMRMIGIVVVLLGLKAAIVGQDHLWAAASIALTGFAGAVMAVWRRREAWACLAGLSVNLAASLVVWHYQAEVPLGDWWIYLVQANVIASAAIALLWLVARKRLYGERELTLSAGPLLATQVSLGLCGNALLLTGPLVQLFAEPAALSEGWLAVGHFSGWLALVLTLVAAFWYAEQIVPRNRGQVLVAFGLAAGIVAACTASGRDPSAAWLGYHVLLTAWAGTGLALAAAAPLAWLQDSELAEFSPFPWMARLLTISVRQWCGWLSGVGLLVLALALRGLVSDPQRPYWSAGAALAVSIMAGAIALKARLPGYVYVSGLLVNLAVVIVWSAWEPWTILGFGHVDVISLAIAAALWLGMELTWPRLALRTPGSQFFPPFAHAATIAALTLLAGLVGARLIMAQAEVPLDDPVLLTWVSVGAMALALCLTLYDREARFPLVGLYALGLLILGMALHAWHLPQQRLGWHATLTLAAYVLATAVLGRAGPSLEEIWQMLRLPRCPESWPEAWFAPVQAVVASGVVMLSLWICLGFPSVADRLGGPLAIFNLMIAGVLLADDLQGSWSRDLRYATLSLAVLLVSEAGWALLPRSSDSVLVLHGTVVLMASLALMTLVHGVVLAWVFPQAPAWSACGRQIGPVLSILASLMLLVVLVEEGLFYDSLAGHTPMALAAVLVVAAGLLGLIAAGICFAVMPGREPLGLSERGRTLYVYAGEVLLVLLIVHLRLTVPEWFRLGLFVRYWPYILMGVAFLGVGLSEFFDRRGLRVLSEPLQRTGVFLSLLPLLAFWAVPLAQADSPRLAEPGRFGGYAVQWFLVGSLYTLVAVFRRSTVFALLAALAVNAGLWALLYRQKLEFLVHPQMWLIPLALVILVAEHLNRDRLSEPQSAALRYLGLLGIYVSSTADMFIAGLRESLAGPLILAVLSVLGVLAGMLLRVRAFLYLGVTFLCLVVSILIWHAAVDKGQHWVGWACGIALGAAIIVLFAVFEKRRNDVVRLLDELRRWD